MARKQEYKLGVVNYAVNSNSFVMPKISDFGQYVKFGQDDDYFENLILFYKRSATHGACVNRIAQMTYGLGLETDAGFENQLKEFERILKPSCLRNLIFDQKLFGMAALEVITNPLGNMIVRANHLPFDRLRPGVKENGKIKSWFYSEEFVEYQQSNRYSYKKPVEIPVFTGKREAGRFILVWSNYTVGNEYLTPPDYESALAEIHAEKEVSDYHLTNVETGFSGATMIQLNNGEPTPEQQLAFENKFLQKYSGSKGHKVVFMYNSSPERAASIENIQLSDADKQYQFLDERNQQKILTAHGIVSPMLIGIKGSTGLGNNADELRTAWELLDSMVIKPKQQECLNFLETILKFNQLDLPLKLEAVPPFSIKQAEVNETSGEVNSALKGMSGREFQNYERIMRKFRKGQITRTEAQRMLKSGFGMTDEEVTELLNDGSTELSSDELEAFIGSGEEIDEDEWELIDEKEVVDKPLKVDLARVPSSQWKVKSEQDNFMFKVRYQYAGNPNPEREFCRKMMSAKRVYRYEDIEQASSRAVNPGWGPRGANTYDLWLYKGGGNCKHFWKRVVYMRRNNKKISVNQARKMINEMDVTARKAAKLPVNDKRVAQIPFDQDNRGFLPSNPQGRGR